MASILVLIVAVGANIFSLDISGEEEAISRGPGMTVLVVVDKEGQHSEWSLVKRIANGR